MRTLLLISTLCCALSGCPDAPKVFQGTVVSYEEAARAVVVKNELPSGEEARFSLEGAEIGAPPAPGDLVRVAYHGDGAERRATRLSNLSRQAELAGKGGPKKK